jgi:membrane-associated phospholipid phosphatase
METTLLWGLDIIRAVQSHANPFLTAFMKLVTNFGAAPAYMALLPLIFWCFDEEKGIRLGMAVMVSTWINLSLKFLLNQPRPFWEAWDPAVGMIAESFNGFPSGHAQISLTMWMIVASWAKKKWAYGIAILLSLLVGFSRVYLGVHFPTDLLGGWILGALVLTAYFLWSDKLKALLLKGGRRTQMMVSAAAALFMILYRPHSALLMPGAVVLGMGISYSITANHIHFRSAALYGRTGVLKALTLAARFVTGIIGVALVFIIFSRLNPGENSAYYPLFFFMQFFLLEFWVYAGAPRLFQIIHLTENSNTA